MKIEEQFHDLKPKCQEFSYMAKDWLEDEKYKEELIDDTIQKVEKEDRKYKVVASSLQCAFCQKIYLKGKSLDFHIKKEHSGLVFLCHLCSKELPNKKYLYNHVLRAHSKNEICPICQKNITIQNLKRHIGMKHKNLYRKECLSCGKILTGSQSLNRHTEKFCGTNVKRIKGEIPCNLCHKKFVEKALKRHIKSDHTVILADGSSMVQTEPDNPCKAKLCHCKEIVCTICFNSFKKEIYLKRHIYIVHKNSDSEPTKCRDLLKCLKCQQEFQSIQSLQKHKREIHDGEFVYDCNKCDAIFKTKRNLIKHTSRLHVPKVTCEKCYKKFPSKKLKMHRKWHTEQEISTNIELKLLTNVLPCTLNCLDPRDYHYHNPIVENIRYF